MPEDNDKHLSSNDDSNLFAELMSDVRRISSDKENLLAHRSKPKPHRKPQIQTTESATEFFPVSDEIQSEQVLFFSRQGVQHKLKKQLKRGQLNIDDRLDLHGLNRQQAQQIIEEFLSYQANLAHRCILIVHGKGTGSCKQHPVLKNLAFQQLKDHPLVLAFASAQPADGGAGALYVLLKSKRLNPV